MPSLVEDGDSPAMQYTLESYVDQPLSPPGSYPVPDRGLQDADGSANYSSFQSSSIEEKKESLVVARNSLELLTSILNTEAEPKPLKVFILNLLESNTH